MADFKTIQLRPMTGTFDTLSSADEVGFRNWRVVKNAITRSSRNRERGGGWRRLFADHVPYNNQDLHDQLTGRLGFYDSYSDTASGGGGFAGFSYPYFAAAYDIGDGTAFPPASGPFGPVYIDDYQSGFFDGCPIFYPFVGVPYQSVYGGQSGHLELTTGYPNYFLKSYVYTSCPVFYEPVTYPGYPYGPPTDLYDPLFNYDFTYCGDGFHPSDGCREAITLLSQIVTTAGRKLVAATMSRVYEMNQSAGNWSLLADGLGNSGYTSEQCGCNSVRGMTATLGGYLFFTNNFDPPSSYFLGDEPSGCAVQSLQTITDLVSLNITQAGGVVVWNGFVIFYDITEDGERKGGKVIWGDLESASAFIEGDTSFAGNSTIAIGATILNAAPLGKWLMFYTDKGIIRATLVGGEDVFNFETVYEGGNAMKYKFSLINAGDTHLFLGESDIYAITQFDVRPTNALWITKAAGMIFAGIEEDNATYEPINKDACDMVTGGFNDETHEAFLSWPTGDSICPTVTLRMNLKFAAADFIDYGFTAFLSFRKDDRATVGQWMEDLGVCARGEVVATGFKDGDPCLSDAVVNPPLYIWNPQEDPSLPVTADSLCSRLVGKTMNDYCRDCASETTFIGASADDFCLKQMEDDIYYRERLAFLPPPCDSLQLATDGGVENGFTGTPLVLDEWISLGPNHCTSIGSITLHQEEPMNISGPMTGAVYDADLGMIFAVRGGYIFEFNATTGLWTGRSNRFADPAIGDASITRDSDGSLWTTHWFDPNFNIFGPPSGTDQQSEDYIRRTSKGISKITGATLIVDKFLKFTIPVGNFTTSSVPPAGGLVTDPIVAWEDNGSGDVFNMGLLFPPIDGFNATNPAPFTYNGQAVAYYAANPGDTDAVFLTVGPLAETCSVFVQTAPITGTGLLVVSGGDLARVLEPLIVRQGQIIDTLTAGNTITFRLAGLTGGHLGWETDFTQNGKAFLEIAFGIISASTSNQWKNSDFFQVGPRKVLFDNAGFMWVAHFFTGTEDTVGVAVMDKDTGSMLDFEQGAGSGSGCWYNAFDYDSATDKVFVSVGWGLTAYRFNGTAITFPNGFHANGFIHPDNNDADTVGFYGLAIASGFVWCVTCSNRVIKTPTDVTFGTVWTDVFLDSLTTQPRIVRLINGLLYFPGVGDNTVISMDPDTEEQVVYTGFDSPYDVVEGAGGKVFAVQLGVVALREIV